MANITDNQLRGIVLRKAYEKRSQGFFAWSNDDFKDLDPSIDFDMQDLFRACDQLREHGLVEFKSVSSKGQFLDGRVKITSMGVDVIEGHSKPSLSINYDQSHHVNVTGSSNVQVGSGNTQTFQIQLEGIVEAINASSGSEDEKKAAKSLLRRFLEHPLVTSIAGGVVSNLKL